MPPDKNAKLNACLKWFQQASEDLRLSKYAMEANPPFLKGSAFHAQQCVEKALKGFLIFHEERVPRTHDLRGLAKRVCDKRPDLRSSLDSVGKLTKYVTASRYPTEINFTKEVVLDAIATAEASYALLHDESLGKDSFAD